MDLRLIALDLDGTTLNSQGKVSPYTKEILEKAIQKGIHVVIASGRALSAIPEDVLNIRGLIYHYFQRLQHLRTAGQPQNLCQ